MADIKTQIKRRNGASWDTLRPQTEVAQIVDIDTITVDNLQDLDNVIIESPSNGQVLKYNGSNWVNSTDAGGTVLSVNGEVPDAGGDISLSASDVDALSKTYRTNWTTVNYGSGGVGYWQKIATITFVNAYSHYNFEFDWATRGDRGTANVHIRTTNVGTTPQVVDAWISSVGNTGLYILDASHLRQKVVGDKVEIYNYVPAWTTFNIILKDSVTEAAPSSIVVHTDFLTAQTTTEPTGTTNFQDRRVWNKSNFNPSNYIPTSEKGANSGVATLNASGKLTNTQIPDYLTGGLKFVGALDLSGNTKTLQDLATELGDMDDTDNLFAGYYWIVSAAGGINAVSEYEWQEDGAATPTVLVWDDGVQATNNTTDVNLEVGDWVIVTNYIYGSTVSFGVINNNDPRFSNYVAKSGDTMTGDLTIAKNNPVLIFKDTSTPDNNNLAAWVSFKDQNNSEKGWMGYGYTTDTNMTFSNTIGNINLTPGLNVGIGTTSPAAKLDVNGEVQADNIHDYQWRWERYPGLVTPANDTGGAMEAWFRTYFLKTTETPDATGYLDTRTQVGDEGGFGGSTYGNMFGDLSTYHAHIYTNIYVHRQFSVSVTDLSGDDPHAIFVDEKFVAGKVACCSNTAYSYTFTKGWHRIDLIYSEGGGGDWIRMGWNPKNYLGTFISDMNPHKGVERTIEGYFKLNAITSVTGSNPIYFGESATGGLNGWSTRLYANGSNFQLNANTFTFNNDGYGSTWTTAITDSGDIVLNSMLHLRANNAGEYAGIGFNRNVANGNIYNSNSPAFQLQLSSDNLELQRYNGAGAFQNYPFTVSGSTGVVAIGKTHIGTTGIYGAQVFGGLMLRDYGNSGLTNGRMYFETDQFYFRAGGEGEADATAGTELNVRRSDGSFSKVWHEGNDGSGSGLEADAVDGLSTIDIMEYQSQSDFPNGTFIETSINYSTYGDSFHFSIEGKSYGGIIPYSVRGQGYIYNSTIINQGILDISGNFPSAFFRAFRYTPTSKLCFWFPTISYWNSFTVRVWTTTSTGLAVNRVTSITNSAKPTSIDREVSFSYRGPAYAQNADQVDNLHASSFLRSDANDSFSGWLQVSSNNGLYVDGANAQLNMDLDVSTNTFNVRGTSNNNIFTVYASDNSAKADKMTLGPRVNNSSYGGNTSGLTINSVAEVRSPQASAAPALTFHYENLATRHLIINSSGEFEFLAPSSENSGVAVVKANGQKLAWVKTQGTTSNSGVNFTISGSTLFISTTL